MTIKATRPAHSDPQCGGRVPINYGTAQSTDEVRSDAPAFTAPATKEPAFQKPTPRTPFAPVL